MCLSVPGVSLSSDFIAGFCGETEGDHQQTVSLLRQVRYNVGFLFAYSMRQVSAGPGGEASLSLAWSSWSVSALACFPLPPLKRMAVRVLLSPSLLDSTVHVNGLCAVPLSASVGLCCPSEDVPSPRGLWPWSMS